MAHKLSKLKFKLYCLLASDAGQDLVEYALVVALIAFGATATMKTLAAGIRVAFTDTSAALGSNIT
jgi:pilus assembly protein Flp/PilA